MRVVSSSIWKSQFSNCEGCVCIFLSVSFPCSSQYDTETRPDRDLMVLSVFGGARFCDSLTGAIEVAVTGNASSLCALRLVSFLSALSLSLSLLVAVNRNL